MKTKLLKLALCAMAALPMGAWAGAEHSFADLNTSYVTPDEGITVGGTTYSYSGDGTKWFGISVNQDDLHVKFELKRSGDATFSLGANYMTVSAAPCRITISGLTVGQSFKLSVASNNSGALTLSATEGCTADAGNPESAAQSSTVFGDFKYTATATTAIITTADAGTRLKSITLDNVEAVTITSAMYATFANNTNSSLAIPSGLKAYGVSAFNESGVTFTEYNVIPSGAGVILKANTAGDYTLFETETVCTYNEKNYLVPVTEAKVVPVYDADKNWMYNYIFANKTNGVGFYKSSGYGTIAVGKAYLSIPDLSVDAREWTFDWSDYTRQNVKADIALNSSTGDVWANQSDGRYYRNKSAIADSELNANDITIKETKGLRFTSAANRLGVVWYNNNYSNCIEIPKNDKSTATITIPNLKPNHTITISSRSSAAECYVTTTTEKVTRDDSYTTGTTTQGNNVFTTAADFVVGNSATFGMNALNVATLFIYSIKITPNSYTPSTAREFFGFNDLDNETTAIEQIETQTIVNDDAWYTLQGVRIAQPSKGIYIHNGKKVFIK